MAKRALTPEEVQAQKVMARILSSEPLFVQNCLQIKDERGQVVPFRYNAVQLLYEERRTQNDFILKARKMGVSSHIIGGDIWACATHRNEHAVCLTHTQDAADKLMAEKIKPMIENSKFPIRVKITKDYIHFLDTDSRYYVGTAGSKRFGRGDDITRIHATEFAHWADPTVLTGVEEAGPNAVGRIETTANGVNFAKTLWDKCRKGEGRYRAIFFPWYCDPRYSLGSESFTDLSEEETRLMEAFNLTVPQLAWRRAKLKAMSQPELFPQEYPATDQEAFLSSGRMVFDWVALMRHETHVLVPKWRAHLRDMKERVDVIVDPNGPLRMWKPPTPGHKYFIGADVAEGLEDGAYSVAQVLDLGEGEVVASWHGHIAPDLFGDILELLGRYYSLADVAPESWPGPGGTTMARLLQVGYPRLWEDVEAKEPGWSTTAKSKPQMILSLAAALRDLRLTIHDVDTIAELRSFVYDEKGRMVPGVGCFSDRVMALGIAWHCSRGLAETAQYTNPRVSDLAGGHRPSISRTSAPRIQGRRIGQHSD